MKSFLQLFEAIEFPKFHKGTDIEGILRKLPRELICQFAVEIAEDVFHLNNEQTRTEARTCLDLIHQWIVNPKSVTPQQLEAAARAASNASDAVRDFANTSANPSADVAGYAVRAASYAAACAAGYSAYPADNAAWAAANVTDRDRTYDQTLVRYRQWAINLHAKAKDSSHSNKLVKMLDVALQTRDKSMFGPIWDLAIEADLIPANANQAEIEKNPMNFFMMLKRVIT